MSRSVNRIRVIGLRGFLLTSFSLRQIAHRIRVGVQGLGEACIALVQSGGAVQSSPKDSFSRRELADNGRNVTEKVQRKAEKKCFFLEGHTSDQGTILIGQNSNFLEFDWSINLCIVQTENWLDMSPLIGRHFGI